MDYVGTEEVQREFSRIGEVCFTNESHSEDVTVERKRLSGILDAEHGLGKVVVGFEFGI